MSDFRIWLSITMMAWTIALFPYLSGDMRPIMIWFSGFSLGSWVMYSAILFVTSREPY